MNEKRLRTHYLDRADTPAPKSAPTAVPAPPEPMSSESWRQHRADLYRYLRRRLPDVALAEDLTQEVLLRLHRTEHAGRAPVHTRALLFRIAHNLVVDYYRAKRDEVPLDQANGIGATTGAAPLKELEPCIAALAAHLPEGYRMALLWDLEGLPQKEIALRQALSLSGAKSRIQRARVLLKQEFERCCLYHFDVDGALVGYNLRTPSVGC